MIKKANFDYGSRHLQSASPYTTMTAQTFTNKGNATKATLDKEKQNDLRTNHFSIGGPSARITNSVQQLGFRPSSAKQMIDARPTVDQKLKDDLRSTHWAVAVQPSSTKNQRPPKEACFVTSNMLNFKWYKPTPSK
jgi:hypothetical protein